MFARMIDSTDAIERIFVRVIDSTDAINCISVRGMCSITSLQYPRCPLEDAKNPIHLSVASPIATRTLNQNGGWHTDLPVVIEHPTQPPSGAPRAAD